MQNPASRLTPHLPAPHEVLPPCRNVQQVTPPFWRMGDEPSSQLLNTQGQTSTTDGLIGNTRLLFFFPQHIKVLAIQQFQNITTLFQHQQNMTYEDEESQGCQGEEQADVDKARLKAQQAVSHLFHFSISLKIYIRCINSRSVFHYFGKALFKNMWQISGCLVFPHVTDSLLCVYVGATVQRGYTEGCFSGRHAIQEHNQAPA